MKKKITKILLIIISPAILTNCCGTRMAKCPDGRPVSFPKSDKCAAKIYQDAVKDFNFNLKATVNVVDQVTVGIDNLEIRNQSILLKEKLNQESSRMQETLKASYLAITRDPCANSERHYKLVESVNTKNYELQQLVAKLSNENKEKEIGNTFEDYLYQRGKREGTAMGKIASALDNYFKTNSKYPNSLDDIQISTELSLLGSSRIEYILNNQNEYSMKFAGEDYALGSVDDKHYKGKDGKTEKVN